MGFRVWVPSRVIFHLKWIEYRVDNGKENGNYRDSILACIGIIRVHIWIIRVILGLYRGNGKENGKYYIGVYIEFIGIMYRDNGKENGNYLL